MNRLEGQYREIGLPTLACLFTIWTMKKTSIRGVACIRYPCSNKGMVLDIEGGENALLDCPSSTYLRLNGVALAGLPNTCTWYM